MKNNNKFFNFQNTQNMLLKIKTPHLLKIHPNIKMNGLNNFHIQKQNLNYFNNLEIKKFKNYPQIQNYSSNGQNFFQKKENSNYYKINQLNQIKYHKIKKLRESLNKTNNEIKNYNINNEYSKTLTKYETIKKLNRSKSTLNNTKKHSKKSSLNSSHRRSKSNKRDVIKILDETIKGLTRLKTIILDENDDDDEILTYKDDDDDVQLNNNNNNNLF